MKKTIRVLAVEADSLIINILEDFECSLEASQKFVGGYVEAVRVNNSITMWLNEEGKLNGLTPSYHLLNGGVVYDIVVGNSFFCGTDSEGDNISLTDAEIDEIKLRFINRHNFELGELI